MLNNIPSVKQIFFYRMIFSTLIQFFVLTLIFFLVKNYVAYNQKNNLINDLLINDSFIQQELIRYRILDNDYAFNLELHNLADERKLDSIKFIRELNFVNELKKCSELNDGKFKLCNDGNGIFYGITPLVIDGKLFGYIIMNKDYTLMSITKISYSIALILITVLSGFLFNFVLLFFSMKKRIEANTKTLLEFISHKKYRKLPKLTIYEYSEISKKFIYERDQVEKLQKEKIIHEAMKSLAEQVAHDIRSPLTALNTALHDVKNISEERRILIKNAAGRINDIANNLLAQYRNKHQLGFSEELCKPELLFSIVDNIVSEKKLEYIKRKITISTDISDSCFGCFAKVNLSSFKRILSNLINNAVEAIEKDGIINVKLSSDLKHIILVIEDNGCGIDSEILSKVTEKGFSFGKKKGFGFGLYYAKEQINKINGNLFITSEIHSGTQIKIILPKAEPPKWFCQQIQLYDHSEVLILDDDRCIGDVWAERMDCSLTYIKINHAITSSDLYNLLKSKKSYDLYLIDFDLASEQKNGLDYIRELCISEKALLVTSSFENLLIRNESEEIGIKIIPKAYVPYIPIIHLPAINHNSDVLILIDDDSVMRMTWSLAAEGANKEIHVFASPDEFNLKIDNFDRNIPIYVDSDLSGSLRGEEYAKFLYSKGFNYLHLTTGYQKESFPSMPWIKSIIDKRPPFLISENENGKI